MSTDEQIDRSAFAPGTLVDHGDGHYSLMYSTFPDFSELFASKGLRGGGYSWRGMVVHLLEEHAPDALESLDFAPAANMFCAISDNLDALRAVAHMLTKLESRDTVADLVEHANLSQYD